MSFDWSQFLNLALHMNSEVSSFPDKEACYRCVASRAYYAVLNPSQSYVDGHHRQSFDQVKGAISGGVHKQLIQFLKNHGDVKVRKLGRMLVTLRQYRVDADYHDILGQEPAKLASMALGRASQIQSHLDSLP